MNKIRVGILFGGKSAEHEVSLLSAKSIIDALDRQKYEPVLISIDKKGAWHMRDALNYLMHADNPKEITLQGEMGSLAIVPKEEGDVFLNVTSSSLAPVDVVFPVLHGTYGEDGTVQGLLKMAGIPFVGAGVLGSAVGMDKDVMKRLLKEAGLPIGKFEVLKSHDKERLSYEEAIVKLGSPLFIKPANAGSSVGVYKVKTKEEYVKAIQEAFKYDKKILVEEFIDGREIECSVLGNEHPIASIPGEVMPTHEFYSYEAKYLDDEGAKFRIPAEMPVEVLSQVQKLAVEAFQVLCCEGMARIDFFVTKDLAKIFINEINTIPGFTKISMYPKMWQASGLSYSDLLDTLIELALKREESESKLQVTYSHGKLE